MSYTPEVEDVPVRGRAASGARLPLAGSKARNSIFRLASPGATAICPVVGLYAKFAAFSINPVPENAVTLATPVEVISVTLYVFVPCVWVIRKKSVPFSCGMVIIAGD